jgi:hypothetical protein
MKQLLFLALLLIFGPIAEAQTAFYTDRAVQQVNVLSTPTPLLAAVPYGSVRVCSLPLTQQQPCLPLAAITDIFGNPISNSIGSLFGQFLTDVTGRYTFGCTLGLNYQVQIAQSASNTPAVNYPITCPGSGNNPTFPSLTVNGNATISGTLGVTGAVTATSPGVFTNTQMNEYVQSLINGCSPLTEFQAEQGGTQFSTDALTGCLAIPVGAPVFNANAVAGYVNNSSTTTFGIGGYFSGRTLVNNAKVNTLNAVWDDTGRIGVGYALNLGANIANVGSSGGALLIEGVSTLSPTSFPAIFVQKLVGNGQWSQIIQQSGGGNSPSPYFTNTDSSGPEALNVNVGSTNNLFFTLRNSGGVLGMQSGFATAPTNQFYFQARNTTGAGNTAYPIVLNPLGGNVGVNNNNPGQPLDVTGNARSSGQFISTVATGTAPLAVSSTTPVANLVAGGNTVTIASGTATLSTTAVPTLSCATTVTVTATGTSASDSIEWAFASLLGNTADGLMVPVPQVGTNQVSFTRCNSTAGSLTGTAMVINWRVMR